MFLWMNGEKVRFANRFDYEILEHLFVSDMFGKVHPSEYLTKVKRFKDPDFHTRFNRLMSFLHVYDKVFMTDDNHIYIDNQVCVDDKLQRNGYWKCAIGNHVHAIRDQQ